MRSSVIKQHFNNNSLLRFLLGPHDCDPADHGPVVHGANDPLVQQEVLVTQPQHRQWPLARVLRDGFERVAPVLGVPERGALAGGLVKVIHLELKKLLSSGSIISEWNVLP